MSPLVVIGIVTLFSCPVLPTSKTSNQIDLTTVTCEFDNKPIPRDYVLISSDLAGYCHDAGIAPPNIPLPHLQYLGLVNDPSLDSEQMKILEAYACRDVN